MPCDRFPPRPPRSSIPYSSRPSSRVCTPQSPRHSSQHDARSQTNQYNLRASLHPYPAIPTANIHTPPHIQVDGQPLPQSAPQQRLVVPGVTVPGTSSSTLRDNWSTPQTLSLPPYPAFSSPSHPPSYGNIFPTFDLSLFSGTPVTSVAPHASPYVHHNQSVYHDGYTTGVEHHPSYGGYHAASQRPQPEQVLHTRSQFEHQSSILQQSSQRLQRQENPGQGMFHKASNFSLQGAVLIDNNAPNLTLNMSDNNFMSSFLKETIMGAEFDSSDPNMPQQCHPGTRVEIIKRCRDFILTCHGPRKLRWVVGSAGVGKSAIMQSTARGLDDLPNVAVGATVFFSINGRHDGTKTVNTIAYQLAAKFDSYRLFVQREITRNPSHFRKSLPTQFDKFIIDPFIRHPFLPPFSRVLIILDGLDECANVSTQKELLGLISSFCVTYPSSPIVWMVASRPEPHITYFFSRSESALSYEKEEILVDSDQAHEDVKHYLRDKFEEIKLSSIALHRLPHWPVEDDFLKIANAAGGLFAYASTVVLYIGDPNSGDPAEKLENVLDVIEAGVKPNLSGEDHPMAQLDALYAHIMSKIPTCVMANTRKLLLLHAECKVNIRGFRGICNYLGLTENAAYGATHQIRSISMTSGPGDAHKCHFEFFHKSFPDYLRDFRRSQFSPDIKSEAEQFIEQYVSRIFEDLLNRVCSDGAGEEGLALSFGVLEYCPGRRDDITLSWPAADDDSNRKIRRDIFECALLATPLNRPPDGGVRKVLTLYMRVLTTCFTELSKDFPLDKVRDFPFDEPHRCAFLGHGILKQVPLETIDYDAIMSDRYIQSRFKGPGANVWNNACQHPKEGHVDDWSTRFGSFCAYCCDRLMRHMQKQLEGYLVTVLEFTAEHRVVEFRFVDPEDGVSEWTYRFVMGKYIFGSESDSCDDAQDENVGNTNRDSGGERDKDS